MPLTKFPNKTLLVALMPLGNLASPRFSLYKGISFSCNAMPQRLLFSHLRSWMSPFLGRALGTICLLLGGRVRFFIFKCAFSFVDDRDLLFFFYGWMVFGRDSTLCTVSIGVIVG